MQNIKSKNIQKDKVKVCGICVGASNISVVEAVNDGATTHIFRVSSTAHEGDIFGNLERSLKMLQDAGYEYIALTGRKISDAFNLPVISEPEAVELAFKFVNKDKERIDAIVSVGAELFIAYILDRQGNISGVRTLGKCASGTGEFFMQQIRRMNLSLPEAIKLAQAKDIYRVSSRCSVFCKSDCTHALNKGQGVGEILAGLCEMMANKVSELLVNLPKDKIMLIGGVALNLRVVSLLKNDIGSVFVPDQALYFEALGAALWIIDRKVSVPEAKLIKNKTTASSYTILAPIRSAKDLVEFKATWDKQEYRHGDLCILGLDVGSTTTKAVMLRESDNAVMDSIYLRTNGNPVEAAKNCYRYLAGNIKEKIRICGLGVTGSGRQIAALHALTEGIVNEIIAHATAAVYFDPEVDTIFEIGGQDAKYTHITNMVPTDYAMNEACSAGTGSFLEESCKETLGIDVRDIAGHALKSQHPPNFNDQCAAFISSDIKTASYEGLLKDDIVGGLVYSICTNYNNRVKGNRIVGNKVFMQGGVCYNQAVPLAMAALLGKKIIVPPEPGLSGAFGVALEIKNRLREGLLKSHDFDLQELIKREVKYHGSFKCKGGAEKCDRACDILRTEVEGKVHFFGGACNKYYNLNYQLEIDQAKLNLVELRQQQLFACLSQQQGQSRSKSVGINKSFLTHVYFPLYYHFFTALGMKVVLSSEVLDHGIQRKGAAFCYPAEIAHGLFQELLESKLDYIFLPQVSELKAKKAKKVRKEQQSTCVILQSEPYCLRSSFQEVPQEKILSPLLDFSKGLSWARKIFLQTAQELGFSRKTAAKAYKLAAQKQEDFSLELKRQGKISLEELKKHPDKIAVVILGRAYNAFAAEANKAIPDKFASRGVMVIPFDCLPFEDESDDRHMYWATGQMLLKASRYIKKHPQLYATFITNFSCGPDSFVVGNVRDIMGRKPMLILEIDSHTADAGVNTRIEAFLDIIKGSQSAKYVLEKKVERFMPARCITHRKKVWVISSTRQRLDITDPKVKVLIPPMGKLGPDVLAAAFRSVGVNAQALPVSDGLTLKQGRQNTSCKECLPLILTAGSLLKYYDELCKDGSVLVYFMPATGGNCRFGQYSPFIKDLIKKKRLKNLAVWAIDTGNSYIGLGVKFNKLALKGTIIQDIMYDIRNALKTLAKDRAQGLQVFDQEWKKIIRCLENNGDYLNRQLKHTAHILSKLPLHCSFSQAKSVALMGEIFVRRDDFCCNPIIERLAKKGFVLRTAPVLEWLHYVDYLVKNRILESKLSLSGRIEFMVKNRLQKKYEHQIKEILEESGLYHNEKVEIEEVIRVGKQLISEHLTGESIVVVGAALKEIMHSVCGIISVGPFACLPTRIIESILSNNMNLETKNKLENRLKIEIDGVRELPFLSMEVDGNQLPPLLDAKMEAFCLQAERLHKKMLK